MHPEGHPLFITFRLANSLPIEALAKLKAMRERELKNSRGKSPEEIYNIEMKHFGRYDEWLDRCVSGPRWLADETVARTLSEKIHAMDGQHFRVLAYCIMPNHVHLLIESIIAEYLKHRGKTAKSPITDALRLLKGNTGRSCNLLLQQSGAFWHHESYDHYARDEQELERIIKYILHNPVQAKLVEDWKKWQFTYISPELGSW
jgi:REP element-mobilizing transposase RayT